MAADLQRDALAADLARRMQARTFGDLRIRILERVVLTLERTAAGCELDSLGCALADVALTLVAEDQQRDQAHGTARDAVVGGGG